MISGAGATTRPAALVANPASGRLAAHARDDVVARLSRRFDLEYLETTKRDEGIELAAHAVDQGHDLVIAFGGDGHVNEVVNGIAHSAASLAIVPGGTMNVFARSLGIPVDPGAAVELVGASPRTRRVPLGKMDDRYFTFSAGCGFDAEAAALVEEHLAAKRRFGELFFYWSALRVLSGSYRHRAPGMVVTGAFGQVPAAMAVVSNCGPYAYLLGRPIRLAPDVDLDGGLDVFALRSMRIEALPLYAWRAGVSGDLIHHGDAFYASDLAGLEVSAEEPFARHVDGEPVPRSDRARFTLERDALTVLVP